jgi:hypothetical protein
MDETATPRPQQSSAITKLKSTLKVSDESIHQSTINWFY